MLGFPAERRDFTPFWANRAGDGVGRPKTQSRPPPPRASFRPLYTPIYFVGFILAWDNTPIPHRRRMKNPMPDLSVITKAKELATYLFTVTQKSPKQFRFSLTGRMQTLCLEVIGHLYRANDTWVEPNPDRQVRLQQRLDRQHYALTALKELDWLVTFACEQGCITEKQEEGIAERLHHTRNLLGAWITSDRKRYSNV